MAKKKSNDRPRVHQDLEGFGVTVNPLGEVRIDYDLDKLNQFLNRTVRDKKFRGRTDLEGVPEEMTRPIGGEPNEDPPLPNPGQIDEDPELIAFEDELAQAEELESPIGDAELDEELGTKLKSIDMIDEGDDLIIDDEEPA